MSTKYVQTSRVDDVIYQYFRTLYILTLLLIIILLYRKHEFTSHLKRTIGSTSSGGSSTSASNSSISSNSSSSSRHSSPRKNPVPKPPAPGQIPPPVEKSSPVKHHHHHHIHSSRPSSQSNETHVTHHKDPIHKAPIHKPPAVPEPAQRKSMIPEPVQNKPSIPEPVQNKSMIPEPVQRKPMIPEPVQNKTSIPEAVQVQSIFPENVTKQSAVTPSINDHGHDHKEPHTHHAQEVHHKDKLDQVEIQEHNEATKKVDGEETPEKKSNGSYFSEVVSGLKQFAIGLGVTMRSKSELIMTELNNPIVVWNLLFGTGTIAVLLTGSLNRQIRAIKGNSDNLALTTATAVTAAVSLNILLSTKYYSTFDEKRQ
ncbi:hypothetical protein Kpol_534p41 [Vanderwaltozyma polyspora DSM 70294]|uniref:Mitochondrial outer membrane protein OM14 C-terminal domain-containing protein n=1 Tax=Vanderwaltozyma polyspora (strain ATCC 22028 / DSM 70294 / BCRC 21397 / CBS 2163 / NBRC 10782 / NRRL Y-8283 / UCD 57-17) TaxID=436907 RepID=A7TJL7_VANPO|nr:uncharacterized protein Kpol_534p41 [Vanderwaltozyma polyspora DSM 70294]EDO17560.1 hypothetical protein Kpol_534p41 [Vanderwaltozyma polyspora DSM 70294]